MTARDPGAARMREIATQRLTALRAMRTPL